ncbi:hypothetical protein C9374_014333 [Naegleria lovaniensis]|uniref:Uncharacterized protein n=1 Tax=Naegleria lovaniensis TaxID=51637 RepID=A0AA88H0E0_NAELO|nr:uncharacterized protein C9374_014333 [Naegleria lovaniensis]KAG2388933.1 hypothetical protein C9374_014333 [Naegleria lovaniensis]
MSTVQLTFFLLEAFLFAFFACEIFASPTTTTLNDIIPTTTQQTGPSSVFTPLNCPLLHRTRQIASSNHSLPLFNYTQDMLDNWQAYHCDGVLNTQFNPWAIQGVKTFDYTYTIVDIDLASQNSLSYCQHVLNSSNSLLNQTLETFIHFNNATLMKLVFIPYLESLLTEQQRNYSVPRTFYSKGFTNKIYLSSQSQQQQDMDLTLLVNVFNFFLFCYQSNPYFETFHTQTLPRIASLSEYPRIQTLDVLFGKTILDKFGKIELTFYNRTQLAFCSDNNDQPFSLSYDHCKGIYVSTWIPLSKHLSLKIIEVLLFSVQLIIVIVAIGIPILVKTFKKFKEQLRITNSVWIIHKGKLGRNSLKEQSNPSPSPSIQLTISETPTSPSTPSTTQQSKQTHQVNTREAIWATMKEISIDYIRIFFDSKLMAMGCCHLSSGCLILNALLFCVTQSEYGTSVHMNVAALLAAVSSLCSGLIPLSGSFMELLLSLRNQHATISVHALIVVFILVILNAGFIMACLITAFSAYVVSQYIRVSSLPAVLLTLIISWAVILTQSLKIYFMLKKNRNFNFFKFKFVRFLMYLMIGIVYFLYEVITELAFLSGGNTYWDTLFTRLFKHRIAGYILSLMIWGFVYVLFSVESFKECYGISLDKKKRWKCC